MLAFRVGVNLVSITCVLGGRLVPFEEPILFPTLVNGINHVEELPDDFRGLPRRPHDVHLTSLALTKIGLIVLRPPHEPKEPPVATVDLLVAKPLAPALCHYLELLPVEPESA
jgi:hypothetical protein